MSRYIDADAVLKEVEELKKSPWYNDDYGFGTKQARQDGVVVVVDLCIKQAQTADVVEVRHGYWEWYISHISLSGDIYYKCSVCGEHDPWQYTTRCRAKFCPNCGAKMDGERRAEE